MRKKIVIVFLLTLCILTGASAHTNEIIDKGWYTVKNLKETNRCDFDYVWSYSIDGVEIDRSCRLILAHRGWGDAPENSLESIKHVKENGYLGYETDVYFTKDSIPVLSHDETINRIARNKDLSKIKDKIYINESTYEELQKYVFVASRKGKVLKEYSNNRITKFEDALKYSKENGLYIAIELKNGTQKEIKSIVKMVKIYRMDNKVRWLSFKPLLLKYVINTDKDEDVNLLCQADYTKDCDVSSKDSYCGTKLERKIYNKLLNTGYNHVYMKGNPSSNDNKQGTITITNLPDNKKKYQVNENKLDIVKVKKEQE